MADHQTAIPGICAVGPEMALAHFQPLPACGADVPAATAQRPAHGGRMHGGGCAKAFQPVG
jgi:hypothetical protein